MSAWPASLLAIPLVVAAAIPAAGSEPAEPTLAVTLAAGPHAVGDRVEAVVELTVPEPARLTGEPRFPTWSTPGAATPPRSARAGEEGDADATEAPDWKLPFAASWGDVEVAAVGALERLRRDTGAGEATVFRQRLELVPFATGRLPLPPRAVAVPFADRTLTVSTPGGLALEVGSVLPEAEEGAEPPAPRPPAEPRRLPWGKPFWWTLAVLGSACAAALWLALRRRPGEAAVALPPPPPFEELAGALAGLEAMPPAAGHTALSRALRRYLGRALDFPAAESSTTEIQRTLAGRRLPGGVAFRAVEVLRECDLVKFARRPADATALARRAATALAIGGEVEAHLAPRAPAEPGSPETPAAAGREEAA